MNSLRIFFAEWWLIFLCQSFVFVGMWFAGRFGLHGYFFLTSPKSFKELAAFSEDEKKRLLQEASKETFRCWRSVVAPVACALVLSAGIAFGWTIPKVTTLPDTWWVHTVFGASFAGATGWFVPRLAKSCVRPFLRSLIERTSHAAPLQ